MSKQASFIDKHGLWSEEQKRQAEDIRRRVAAEKLRYVRLAWGDTHGYSRAKTLTVPAFLSALSSGYNIGVATTTLDSAGARVFASFTRGGGMGLEEMTGSPNLTVVADPATFRLLPWVPGTGWILCDEYFNDGRPFHFAPRALLRRAAQRLAERGYASIIGTEIEWYLLRVADDRLVDENIGAPGTRGRPVRTFPAEPGYHYHSESNMDLMAPVFDALGGAFEALELGLRSIENEWGPGQVECTFAPCTALEAADNVLLFRTATRQICRRLGYFATFMSRPALKGFYASGWHLHQSLADAASGKKNVFVPKAPEALSPLGRSYLAGLLQYAVPATIFATPTVNGYRRFRANSLAPDRTGWRTGLGNPRPIRISTSCRRSSPALPASSISLHRRRLRMRLMRPNGRCCPKRSPKRLTRSTRSRCSAASSAISSSSISSSSSAANGPAISAPSKPPALRKVTT
jgi:glutamine synthetase